MRPKPQSFFRHPLTTILGTEAGLRIIRVLAVESNSLTIPTIAKRTSVSEQSVRTTIRTLVASGAVRRHGQGRAASYQFDTRHPLAPNLRSLFQVEADRVRRIFDGIKNAATSVQPPVLAVWATGDVVRGEDTPDSEIELQIATAEQESTPAVAEQLRSLLKPLEDQYAVPIRVSCHGPDDLARLVSTHDPFWRALSQESTPLYGPTPAAVFDQISGSRPTGSGRMTGIRRHLNRWTDR